MSKGKLIVIEGTDGSGKATQARMLTETLTALGHKTLKISFPRYGHPMAKPVEYYLQGRFGDKPEDVSAYTASIFYAIDRFDSFKTEWQHPYNDGYIIVADRYTTSNALHQTEKLNPEERVTFLNWIYDLEYNKIGIPRPNLVLYLNVDPSLSYKITHTRTGKPGVKGDIHEKNAAYLKRVHDNASEIINYSGWVKIDCSPDGHMLTEDEVHAKILRETRKLIPGAAVKPN